MRRPVTAALLATVLALAAPARAQEVEYYHLDAVGNVRAITNQAGQVIERHDYLPFGEELCGSVPCSALPAGQPRRFTGKERDAETGLDYFGARYYRANIGRFTTIDPVYTWRENLVDPQRWNRYSYGRNNPLRYVDPDGRAVMEIPQATLARNAAIRGAVAEFFGMGNPNQHPHALFGGVVADFLLGAVLPQNAQEYKAQVESSALGMVAPMAVIGVKAGAITMDEAVAQGAKYVGGEGVLEATGKGTNFQFRRTVTNAAGQTETKISRFDLNPADPHVRKAGPHLNTETQVNGKIVAKTHTPIDPRTVRRGDVP